MNLYKKTYGVTGYTSDSAILPYGNKKLRVNFKNGVVNALRGTEPAIYTTDNQAYQAAIEASAKFKTGKISLIRKVLVGTTDETPPGGATDNTDATTIVAEESSSSAVTLAAYPNVKNSQQAKAVLSEAPYSVALTELGNKTAILAKAEELGVSFPNWRK